MGNKSSVSKTYVLWAIGGLIGCVCFNLLWRFAPFLNISERKFALTLLAENSAYEHFWKTGMSVLSACIYIISVCSGFADLGKKLTEGFCLVMGIWWGSFLTENILVKGIKSLLELGNLLFPESIFYVAAYISCIMWVDNMSTSSYRKRKSAGKNMGKQSGLLVLSIFFFVLWCLSTFYVNLR